MKLAGATGLRSCSLVPMMARSRKVRYARRPGETRQPLGDEQRGLRRRHSPASLEFQSGFFPLTIHFDSTSSDRLPFYPAARPILYATINTYRDLSTYAAQMVSSSNTFPPI